MPQPYQDRSRSGGYRDMPDTRTNFRIDGVYLKDGYFYDDKCEKMREGILDTLALDVAKVLVNTGINSHQLRRFFNQLRAVERSIGKQRPFDSAKADVLKLKSAAAYQVGRGMVREDFKRFIDRNVDLAVQKECNFAKGFIPHFAAVLGYFVYLTRERQ